MSHLIIHKSFAYCSSKNQKLKFDVVQMAFSLQLVLPFSTLQISQASLISNCNLAH